jgi:hypothetical protein
MEAYLLTAYANVYRRRDITTSCPIELGARIYASKELAMGRARTGPCDPGLEYEGTVQVLVPVMASHIPSHVTKSLTFTALDE